MFSKIGKLLTFAVLTLLLISCGERKKEITLLAGSGLKGPLTQIVEKYQRENPGVEVITVYGGSGALLSMLKEGRGDLFIPGADHYLRIALKEGLIEPKSVRFVAYHTPVLVVRKEFADRVKSLEDLAKVNLRIGTGDPKAAAVGRATEKILKRAGIYEKVAPKIAVKTPTVSQLLVYLNTGQIDAAFIWKDLAPKVKNAVVIPIPPGVNEVEPIKIGVAARSENKEEASRLAEYIAANREIFEKMGFTK